MFELQDREDVTGRAGSAGKSLSDEPFPMPEPSAEVALDGARFNRVDFSGIRFASFNVHGSRFEGCDFSGAAFEQLSMGATPARVMEPRSGRSRSSATACSARHPTGEPYASFGNVRFERCVFDRVPAAATSRHTSEAEFVDCIVPRPGPGVQLLGPPDPRPGLALDRDRNEFTGNDFTGAESRRRRLQAGSTSGPSDFPPGRPTTRSSTGSAPGRRGGAARGGRLAGPDAPRRQARFSPRVPRLERPAGSKTTTRRCSTLRELGPGDSRPRSATSSSTPSLLRHTTSSRHPPD